MVVHKLGLLFAVTVIGVSVFMMSGCGSAEVSKTGSAGAPVATDEKKTEEAPALAKIGDKVSVGQFEVIAKQTSTAKQVGNEFMNKKSQGTYILIDLEVKNLDKEARMIDSSMFKLVDSDGTTYDPDPEANLYVNQQNNFFLSNVNPKLSAKGKVVFDMPADAKELKLEVASGVAFAAKETVLIDLQPAKKK
ncbi:DUF4352 domain-containing protein [Brevibacillus laterosporus]|uniref:DUF4352 domain-containing protein n=1 Tax=Brevibacillus laterosporus TaxID=1465 RepID=UPI00215CF989|nr:DUF4352 domain-containing protein [Brevibacillus laterosporus]MCR8939811.1 DUF4352 domain-containing protein [Brevibacillus laterosporus]MCZ0842451.1 DUF4352 domain-containing protein [Brevibacillus laterosporus]MCZ0846448.1 DUF4352 domain-containing protein [Brevibacillus laterosporus]